MLFHQSEVPNFYARLKFKMYCLLKDIEEKIEKKLNSLKIKAEKKVKESIQNRRFYYMSKGIFQGKRVVFKAQIANYKKIQEEISELTDKNLKHEIILLKKVKANFVPRYLKSGLSPSPWLVYQYIKGKTQGRPFELLPSFMSDKNLKPLISLILQIQKINQKTNLPLRKYDFKIYFLSYLKKIRLLKFAREYLKNEEIEKVKKILRKNKDLLDKGRFVLTHGDLHGENIVQKPNGKLVLVDWETVHFNNPAYDIAYLWLKGFLKPDWQKKFLKYFFNLYPEAEFKKLFQIVVLHRIPNEIEYWGELKNKKNVNLHLKNFKKVLNGKI